jgi:hypothetical protein
MKIPSLTALAVSCAALASGAYGCSERAQRPLETKAGGTAPATGGDEPSGGTVVAIERPGRNLEPGESTAIEISVQPPGKHLVHVSLLGDTEGAYVDLSELVTDSSGVATVKVTVPSDSGGFRLRASVGAASTEITIGVVQRLLGALRIEALYSGLRPIERWSVAILEDRPCIGVDPYQANYSQHFEAIADYPGGNLAVYDPIVVQNVPADRRVTLLLRGEEYVYGCREGIELEVDQVQAVSVAVTNRPIRVASLDLDLNLGLDLTPGISQPLGSVLERMVAAFSGGYAHDVEAMLAQMAELAESPAAFQAAADQGGWLMTLSDELTEPGALTSRVRLWLSQGMSQLFTSDTFAARVTGSSGAIGNGLLEMTRVAGADPIDVGMPTQFAVTLETDASDTLLLGSTLYWQPAVMLAALGELEARRTSSDVTASPTGAAQSLADAINCNRVGTALAGPDDQAFDGCGGVCVAALCEEALARMWNGTANALSDVMTLGITAAGPADIDADASALGFAGAWVGEVALTGQDPIGVGGTFAAARHHTDPR